MNDKELVSRMQHGDMQAFDELYERYKDGPIYGMNMQPESKPAGSIWLNFIAT